MLFYVFGAFAISLFNLSLFLITRRSRNLNPTTKAYFQWTLFVSLWSFGYGITLSGCFDYNVTLLWNKFCQAMALLIGPFFFKFISVLITEQKKYKNLFLFYIGIAVSLAIVLISTDLLVESLWSFNEFKYQPKGGPLYGVFIIFFFWCNSHGYYLALRKFKRSSGILRKQLKIFLISTGIGYGLSSSLFLQGLGLRIPPYGIFIMFSYVIILGYAIHKYKFLDIQVIVKRTLVFAGLVSFVFGVFSAATFLVRDLLGRHFGIHNFWINGVSIFLIVLGYDPLRRFLVNLTDKYFFQKKYDYQKLLKDASRGISKIKSLQHLLSLVVHFITMRMRVTNAAVLLIQDDENRYKLAYQRGFQKNFMEYFVDQDSELIRYLSEEHEAIDIENVKDCIEAGNKKVVKGKESRKYNFEEIKKTMEELETSCCIPSFLGKELRNILILGNKKSGDYYVEADLNVLYTLAQESAIAIENARLYDEALNKTKELSNINGQLEYAKNLLMKALNDTEVANKQLQDTQAQLIHEQKMATLGRLAASVGHEVNNPLTILSMNVSRVLLKLRKNPDLKVNEIMDTFDKMEQNIGRIKAVVNTLTGLLKKSEKGKFEPLSLKLILEETLPLVQFQTYLDNLTGTEVDFEVPGNLPLVRGDLERLQEVFLNLFINAYHAMEGKQYRRIRVTAESDPTDQDMVAIRFQDNGKGMDDETRKKIFNYRFTTKAPGKGSGLGSICVNILLNFMAGNIHVHSKLGEGTTFVISLPSTDKKIVTPKADPNGPFPNFEAEESA
jgi:signal transduction histidine kinase